MELAVNRLRKTYGNRIALDDICFALREGVYGILGPNGAGKSTLINILTGNLRWDSGEILLDQKIVDPASKAFRTHLGYMPQQQAIYPNFTPIRFLAYIAALRGMSTAQARERIPYVLELVGLAEVSRQKNRTLSGGMKQRLLIAQALLGDPDILLLDEPTAGLDPRQRIMLRNTISEIAFNKVVLLATHVVSDIESISKEVLLLKEGHLLCKDTRANLTQKLNGRVVELYLTPDEYSKLPQSCQVVNLISEGDRIFLRVLLGSEDLPWHGTQVRPTMEDVYLAWFGEEAEPDEDHRP